MMINYDGKIFRSSRNSASGEIDADTMFHYHQSGRIVWAEYRGGRIARGHLIAVCDSEGVLDMRYHHVNTGGELMTGTCKSTPEVLDDGRIRLHETWQWTSGGEDQGNSIIEEFIAK